MELLQRHTDRQLMQELIQQGHSEEGVFHALIERNYAPEEARQLIEACKKLHCMKQQKTGLALLVIGSLICFSSCILTMLELMPTLTDFFLYGMTSAGVVVVFGGLVMVFEKTSSFAPAN
jgi:uncharacterized protein YjeT (DUF2065 family)